MAKKVTSSKKKVHRKYKRSNTRNKASKKKAKRSAKNNKKVRRISKPKTKRSTSDSTKSTGKVRKRDTKRFKGLEKSLFSRVKQEYFDYDYIEQLGDDEKQWLSNFINEYLGANLNSDGKKFHKSKEMRKDVFDKNNARQRDIYSIMRATGKLDSFCFESGDFKDVAVGSEDAMIELIDAKRELERKLKKS